MALHEDASQALDILERLQTKLRDSNDATHEDDLTNLIYMLESPLFCQILNLNDSITQLKKVQAKYVLNDDDYDFDAGSGELILHAPEQLTEYDQSSPSVRAEAPTNQDSGADTSTNSEGELAMSNYATSAVFVAGIRAAAQGRGLEVIVLQKVENMSLGFSVVGLKSEHRGELGIFVQKIQPGGLAHRDGRLQENDHILAIDGEVLETTISHPQAISLLQRASGRVELVVARGHQGAAPVAVTTTEPGAPGNNAALDRTPSAVSDASDMVLSTEWTQLEVIDLLNDGSGLGFGIIGGKSTGVVVKTILPGGIADRDGRLRSGDHILQIGEVNVRGMGSEQVATVLRQSGAHVRLIVARGVQEQATDVPAHAPIVPTHQLDEHLHHLNEMLLALHGSQGAYLIEDNPTEFLAHLRHQEALERQRAEMPEGAHMGELPEAAHMVSEMPAEEERFEVELVKDIQGLGITIAGYVGDRMQDELSGIFVRSIAEGSAAALDGRIQLNDQIIAVDAQPLEGFTNQQAVDVLRNTGQIVRLKLARYRHGPKYQQLQHYISYTNPQIFELGSQSLILSEVDIHIPISATHNPPLASSGKIHSLGGADDHNPTWQPPPQTYHHQLLNDTNLLLQTNSHSNGQTEDNQLGFGADSETLTEDQRAANLYSGELEPDVEASLKTMWQPQIGEGYDIVVAQLSKFKEGGGLGISLEGTVDVENGVEKRPHHYIRSVLEDGPVGLNGVLQGGDELLEVNAIRLHGLNHKDVVKVLKDLPQHVRIVCARRLHDDDENEGDDDGTQEVFQESSFTTPAAPMSPATERLVKAKSDQDLPTHSGDAALSRLKSRSLEPLADFAMWSGEPTVIELVKGDRGLGFSILDYQDPVSPSETVIVIRSLVPGGVAQMDGRLVPGDRLIFVNDVNLENATLDQAVQALKGAPRGLVNIGVYKPLPLPEIGESSTDDFFDIPLEPAIGDVAPSIPPFSEASAFTAMEAEPPSLPSLSPPHSAPPTPPRTPPPSYDTLLPDNEAITMVTEDAAGPEITEHQDNASNVSEDTNSDWLKLKAQAADQRIEYLLAHPELDLSSSSHSVASSSSPQGSAQEASYAPFPAIGAAVTKRSLDQGESPQRDEESAQKRRPEAKTGSSSDVSIEATRSPYSSPSLYKLVKSRVGSQDSDTASQGTETIHQKQESLLSNTSTVSSKSGLSSPPSSVSSALTSPSHSALSSPKPFVAGTPETRSAASPGWRKVSSPRSVESEIMSMRSGSAWRKSPKPATPATKPKPSVPPKPSPKPLVSPKPVVSPKPTAKELDFLPTHPPPTVPSSEPTQYNMDLRQPVAMDTLEASPPLYLPLHTTSSDLKSTSSTTSPPGAWEPPSSPPRHVSPPLTSPMRHVSPPHSVSPVPSPPLSHASPLSSLDHGDTTLERNIRITKGQDQLGLTVEPAELGTHGCVVKALSPSGAVAKDGRVTVGDYVTSINNESLRKITNAQARAILRRAQLLGTDISITYISVAEVAALKHPHRPEASPPQPPASQLSPNSSLASPVSQKSSQSEHSISGGRRTTSRDLDDDIEIRVTEKLIALPADVETSPHVTAETTITSAHVTTEMASGNVTTEIASPHVTAGTTIASPPHIRRTDGSWGPPRVVLIHRQPGETLGINIIGGRVDLFNTSPETRRAISGIFIKHVSNTSPAGKDGLLNKGDRILQVDDSDLREATHDEAVAAIKQSTNPVRFLVQSLVQPTWSSQEIAPGDQEEPIITAQESPEVEHLPAEPSATKNTQQPLWPTDDKTEIPRGIAFGEEDEDEYGYTKYSLLKRYGDLGGQLHMVEVDRRGNNGLGLSLAGNRDLGTMSVFVVGIQPESPSARDGRIRVGDELLEINGQTLFGRCHLNASAIIKAVTSPSVKIVLLRRENFLAHMAIRPLRLPPVEHKDDPSTLIPKKPRLHDSTEESVDEPIQCTESPVIANHVTPTESTPDTNTVDLSAYSDVTTVTLVKANQGLGFAIHETPPSGAEGVYVKAVTPGGPASQQGALSAGDRILAVEGNPLISASYTQAIEMLRRVKRGPVSLTFSKSPAKPNTPGVGGEKPAPITNGTQELNTQQQPSSPLPPASPSQPLTPPPTILVPQEDPATCPITPGRETVIEIQKGKTGLGLSIIGGSDTLLGTIIVHEVYEEGAAAKDARLWAGDQVLEVNNVDLRSSSHERAISVLRQTPSTVRMVVFRDETLLKDEDIYEVFTVDLLKKPGKGLGLTIVGRKNDTGVFISDIVKGGVAESDGRLSQGDQILSVNGEDLKTTSQEAAATLLKTLMGKVSLTLGRLKPQSGSSSRRSSSQSGHSNMGLKKSDSSVSNRSKGKHSKNLSTSDEAPPGVALVSYKHRGDSDDGGSDQTFPVRVSRDTHGSLGVSISGGVGWDFPVTVTELDPAGPVALTGQITSGDHILAINGQSTSSMSHTDAVQCLKHAAEPITLHVQRGEGLFPLSPSLPPREELPSGASIDLDPLQLSESQSGLHATAHTVTLDKGPEGLGFSIVGGYGSQHGDLPIYVKTVYATGAAAQQGALKRGDQLLAVNGQSLDGATHTEAVSVLTRVQGAVELTVLS